jgi:hypothetical protein
MNEEREGCAFVMNVGRLIGADSYVLAPGHELRRASAPEVAFIKDTIKSMGMGPGQRLEMLWERELGNSLVIRLPESEWRYFVVAGKVDETLGELKLACDLARLELEVGFMFSIHSQGHSVSWEAARLFHVLENTFFERSFFVDVTADDVEDIRTTHELLRKHFHSLAEVSNLLGQLIQLGQLKALPHDSRLRFLGYFAILESLITHAPQPEDPYDSITRQVKKKLALLDRRFSQKIDYSPFGKVPAETVWTKMYAYRSNVAHGSTPQFTGELAALKNHETALALIKETVKAVIRQVLVEPQLLLDLREC